MATAMTNQPQNSQKNNKQTKRAEKEKLMSKMYCDVHVPNNTNTHCCRRIKLFLQKKNIAFSLFKPRTV